MTRARRSPARPVYHGAADDPYTMALQFTAQQEREAAEQKKRAALPEIHHECTALINAGIMPPSVVRLARHLRDINCLRQCFPSIAPDDLVRVVTSRANIQYTVEGWKLISI